VIIFGAGIGSIYAYDAQLEAQASSLEILNWVPPIAAETPKPVPDHPLPVRSTTKSNTPVDPNIHVSNENHRANNHG
jgi:hypothetical protein